MGVRPHPVCFFLEKGGMIKIASLAGIVFLLSSCAFIKQQIAGFNASVSPGKPAEATVENFKLPSMSDQSKSGHWITRSPSNALVIIGVSNRMVKAESEITAAKEDAAHKASMYHSVGGTIESFYSAGGNALDFIADSQMDIVYDTDIAKYTDRLTFDPERDVVITDETVFVRFTYAAATPASVNFTASLNADGRPDWTFSRNLPQFDGYITAVGLARNQIKLKDTIRKSSDAAVAWMIAHISTQFTVNDRTGMGNSSQTYSKSTGKVKNFQIIEFWIDPKTGYVYTLAIAQQSN